MERVEKVELIQKAIEQLIEQEEQVQSKRRQLLEESFVAVDNTINKDDEGEKEAEHRHQLLSQLLTQLESLKEDSPLDQMSQSTNLEEIPSDDVDREKEENVVKELRKIQKQNFVTHCLLSAMIVLTLTWQLSEVSLILKMKDGLNHPLRSIGSMVTSWIKRPPPPLNVQEGDLNDSAKQLKHKVEAMSLPKLKVPELPHVELPSLDFITEDD
ncbi:uncharacterized protein LOC107795457 [Nicotiana tabacum]|uniref:Uncharacterized protein LOC107795457 n=2 Tax=Nicotiana TaxID=4085 RepID=A0A1S4AAB3_TOBAC|nr:PREDICTED: uncharacterized protein LOC104243525 [Nicotiana sylvestris]XP_016473583.1 PREDICTED: uncharacterized protein LOC107795457 [Nicotiana tabacum]